MRVRAVWMAVAALVATTGVNHGAGAAQGVPPAAQAVVVRPIEPPTNPLPPEAESAGETRFSFIVYGDTRSPVDGKALQPDHGAIVDTMVERTKALASTPFPVRFVLQTGDAVANGTNAAAWNISFSPLIERLTRVADLPYFFAVGNHDVAFSGDSRAAGLRNVFSALSNLMPPEDSPRRLNGYPAYAFGYGNLFAIAIDSNISGDARQLAWVTDQLERLDRTRYRHIILFFHHPPFSSGPHGGVAPGLPERPDDNVERQAGFIRTLYAPLFRRFHVRMTLAGHEHLYDHWIERYVDGGRTYRRDDLVTGGGGAPIYTYRGEPDVHAYLAAGAKQQVRLEHAMRPGLKREENPHHFVIVQVDGDRLSLEVIGIGQTEYKPYGQSSGIQLNDPN